MQTPQVLSSLLSSFIFLCVWYSRSLLRVYLLTKRSVSHVCSRPPCSCKCPRLHRRHGSFNNRGPSLDCSQPPSCCLGLHGASTVLLCRRNSEIRRQSMILSFQNKPVWTFLSLILRHFRTLGSLGATFLFYGLCFFSMIYILSDSMESLYMLFQFLDNKIVRFIYIQ